MAKADTLDQKTKAKLVREGILFAWADPVTESACIHLYDEERRRAQTCVLCSGWKVWIKLFFQTSIPIFLLRPSPPGIFHSLMKISLFPY